MATESTPAPARLAFRPSARAAIRSTANEVPPMTQLSLPFPFATAYVPSRSIMHAARPAAYDTTAADAAQVTTKETEAVRKAAAEPVWQIGRTARALAYASALLASPFLVNVEAGTVVLSAPNGRTYKIDKEGNGYVLTKDGTRLTTARSKGAVDARATLVSFAAKNANGSAQ